VYWGGERPSSSGRETRIVLNSSGKLGGVSLAEPWASCLPGDEEEKKAIQGKAGGQRINLSSFGKEEKKKGKAEKKKLGQREG